MLPSLDVVRICGTPTVQWVTELELVETDEHGHEVIAKIHNVVRIRTVVVGTGGYKDRIEDGTEVVDVVREKEVHGNYGIVAREQGDRLP